MDSGVFVTINLKGHISGPIKHTDKQLVTVDVSTAKDKYPVYVSRKIQHNDRPQTKCFRKVRISEEVVDFWAHSECPHWEKAGAWKGMKPIQKIESFINNFDEGYGVSYEFIN